MGFEFLEENVGWDLEDDVGNEEDSQGVVVLRILEVEFVLQAENGGIGDIGSVEKGEKVEDAEDGDDAQVNFGDEFALGGVRGALDVQVVVVFSTGMRDVGIIVIVRILLLFVVQRRVRRVGFFCEPISGVRVWGKPSRGMTLLSRPNMADLGNM